MSGLRLTSRYSRRSAITNVGNGYCFPLRLPKLLQFMYVNQRMENTTYTNTAIDSL